MSDPSHARLSTPDPLPSGLSCQWHAMRREWSNYSFRRHRQFDAYLVTMHQSGTHWLKFLLTLMIAREHGLPEPENISQPMIIGGPRQAPLYELKPRLGHSHTIPSGLLRRALGVNALGFPNYLILVRDIRDLLIAHYRKWQANYDCSFSEFLRGDIKHKRFEKDIWWDFRFLNAWGAIAQAYPARTHCLRYEQLREAPVEQLHDVVRFLALELANPAESIDYALANAGKEAMAKKDVSPYGMAVVNSEQRSWDEWYNERDRVWLSSACRRFLKHDFGYNYADWS